MSNILLERRCAAEAVLSTLPKKDCDQRVGSVLHADAIMDRVAISVL